MINLVKGQSVNLDKGATEKVLIGLGWDVNRYGGVPFDLDTSVFMLNEDGKCPGNGYVAYYNNLKCPGVTHLGDNKDGVGEGDDERIEVDFSAIPDNIACLTVVVSIHEADKCGQNFGQVTNAYAHICYLDENGGTTDDVIHYDLLDDFSTATSLFVCEIYKHNGEWKVAALCGGSNKGFEEVCAIFGL